MRPIDADALKVRLSGCMILMPNGEKCTAKRVIDTQGTIQPERENEIEMLRNQLEIAHEHITRLESKYEGVASEGGADND